MVCFARNKNEKYVIRKEAQCLPQESTLRKVFVKLIRYAKFSKTPIASKLTLLFLDSAYIGQLSYPDFICNYLPSEVIVCQVMSLCVK